MTDEERNETETENEGTTVDPEGKGAEAFRDFVGLPAMIQPRVPWIVGTYPAQPVPVQKEDGRKDYASLPIVTGIFIIVGDRIGIEANDPDEAKAAQGCKFNFLVHPDDTHHFTVFDRSLIQGTD